LAGRPKFTRLGKAQGLVSNTIFGILEGNDGLLWLSSNRGILALSPKAGWARHFDQTDGLPSADFNFGALLRDDRDGRMYFGGPEGVVAFFPADVSVNTHAPDIAGSATTQGGRVANFFSVDQATPGVELQYPERSITFDFAALDYASPEKNHYRYQLESFDPDWIDSDGHRRATYTNLPAGEYVFKVRGANNDGVWSPEPAQLRLNVIPPPWLTGWAYMSYALMVLASIGVFLRIQYRKLEIEKAHARELETQVELRTQELAERNQDLQDLNKQLKESSMSDSLTGLRNRRYLYEFLETEAAVLDRSYIDEHGHIRQPAGLDLQPGLFFMMIDLDGFKVINDEYGHHAGDKALLQVCDILRKCARKSDTVIRWGGDEFLLVGQCGGAMGAEKLAERVRFEINHHQYQLGDGHIGKLSASIGLSLYPFAPAEPSMVSWEQAIDIADQASYLAKQSRKNAWVAIYSTEKTASADQLRSLKVKINEALKEGVVEVKSSMEDSFLTAFVEAQERTG
jgi:diguanylate cyclase (GGDEF)-like protein